MKYRSLEQTIRRLYEKQLETDANDQIAVGSYVTKAFEACPVAQKLYANLPKDVDVTAAEQTAIHLDKLFDLERTVVASESASHTDVEHADHLATKVMDLAKSMKLEKEHSFVQGHLDLINKYLGKEGNPFASPPKHNIPDAMQNVQGPGDRDNDNTRNYRISRGRAAQRKLKIIDND